MEIKQASIDELDQIVLLFDAYRVWYRKESDLEAAKLFLDARLELKDSIIYYAIDDSGTMVGFTQLYPSFSSTRMQKMWILNDLFVKPSHRGQGISKALIAQAKLLCNTSNACGILLETEKNNDIGNRLYPATGFKLEENNFYFWSRVRP